MKRKLLLLAAIITLGGLMGCEGVIYMETEPPPLRVEIRPARPSEGAIWISGHWGRQRNEFVWISGHWERHPRGNWVPGYWAHRGHRYQWVEGHWEGRSGEYARHRRHHH